MVVHSNRSECAYEISVASRICSFLATFKAASPAFCLYLETMTKIFDHRNIYTGGAAEDAVGQLQHLDRCEDMGRSWPELWHTVPQEAGGPSLLQFKRAMMQDAASQEGVVGVLGTLLDKTIECNDRLGRVSKLAEFEAGTCHLSASAYLKRIMK